MSAILAKAGVRRGPGKTLAESAPNRTENAGKTNSEGQREPRERHSSHKTKGGKTGRSYHRENTHPPATDIHQPTPTKGHKLDPLPASYTKQAGQVP